MKNSKSLLVQRWAVILILVIGATVLLEPAYCQTDKAVLLVKQTPPYAGTTIPAVGLHYFDPNTLITLTAIPKSGYRFVYWLGDVSDPMANVTITYLNTTKIIIAVFERFEYEFSAPSMDGAPGQGGGGLIPSPADYAGPRWQPERRPLPIPEPATFLLLAFAAAMLRKRC